MRIGTVKARRAMVVRRTMVTMKQHLADLGLEMHPDKTVIGPIARGFDFLGYRHERTGLRLSEVTLRRYQEKLTPLYERYRRRLQVANRQRLIGRSPVPLRHEYEETARRYLNAQPVVTSRKQIAQLIEAYKRRFAAWACGGL